MLQGFFVVQVHRIIVRRYSSLLTHQALSISFSCLLGFSSGSLWVWFCRWQKEALRSGAQLRERERERERKVWDREYNRYWNECVSSLGVFMSAGKMGTGKSWGDLPGDEAYGGFSHFLHKVHMPEVSCRASLTSVPSWLACILCFMIFVASLSLHTDQACNRSSV
jgi:hypothetical protein